MTKYKILVVDDEESLCEILQFNLEVEGYEVDVAYSAEQALNMHPERYSLLLLDVMMGETSGFKMARQLKSRPETAGVPIIFCTARDTEDDTVAGLNIGADDYIAKPFGMMELLSRIRALLRRAGGGPAAQQPQRAPLLTVGDLSLDTEERVAIRDGKTIDLTAKEYDLIELLMKNPRRVYSRESLMDLVWGYSYAGDYRTVDVHIRRLREKLEPDPAKPVHIMTKWGVGYYFKGDSQPTV